MDAKDIYFIINFVSKCDICEQIHLNWWVPKEEWFKGTGLPDVDSVENLDLWQDLGRDKLIS